MFSFSCCLCFQFLFFKFMLLLLLHCFLEHGFISSREHSLFYSVWFCVFCLNCVLHFMVNKCSQVRFSTLSVWIFQFMWLFDIPIHCLLCVGVCLHGAWWCVANDASSSARLCGESCTAQALVWRKLHGVRQLPSERKWPTESLSGARMWRVSFADFR